VETTQANLYHYKFT